MKMFILALFCTLSTMLSASSDNHNLFIVGGFVTTADQYPFIASLQYSGVGHICGGSILRKESPAIILTAAHCVEDMDISEFYVRLNADDVDGSNGDYIDSAVTHILIHSEWTSKWEPPYKHDIALLWLSEDISSNNDLEIVTLPPLLSNNECCITGDPLQLIGYGSDIEMGDLTDTLEFLDLEYIDESTCHSLYNSTNLTWFDSTIYDGMNCAAAREAGSCHGDSGGPLVKSSTNQQVGIVSWGIGCADTQFPGTPGVYTEVGSYIQWIEENIKTTPEPTTPTPTFEWTVTDWTFTEWTSPICNEYDADNDEIIGKIACGSSVTGTHHNSGNSVIYKFTVSGRECSITADTCGSSFDTGLGIHDSNGNLIDSNCNDDGKCNLQSSITQILPSNTPTEYWLKIGGYSGATGDYVLNLQCTDCEESSTTTITTTAEPTNELACPNNDEQILIGGLNDIAGCGLDCSCADRYNKETIEECRLYCKLHANCVAYSWTPPSGDINHPGQKVCTIYDSVTPNQTWGPEQIMCQLTL